MANSIVQVVMIDDDRDDFDTVKELLERQTFNSYRLTWINTYEEGLKRLQQRDGDVFLLDYQLGKMSGIDLLKEAGGKDLSVPVIMLTGVEDLQVDLDATEAGASFFVPKVSLVIDHILERTIRYAIRSARDFAEVRSVDRLKMEKETAELASVAKDLFLANVSHEIRTPLGAILGFAELALMSEDNQSKNLHLEVIKRNSKHLLLLVNDLLDLSKVEAGRYDLDFLPCDWRSTINEVIQTLQVNATARGNTIQFRDDKSIPRFISTDAHCLQQILLNLLGNAVKFTENGSIEIAASLNPNLELTVKDTGIGVSDEQRKRLFQPFEQGESGLRRRYGGTGLGLYLSRKMSILLGGSLELVSSAPNAGTIFSISIPPAWTQAPASSPRIETGTRKNLQDYSVLLVEDSEDNQILFKSILSKAGLQVDIAENGKIAVARARESRYDIILMDIQMPEMDGFEATSKIRRFDVKTPVVALSARAMKGDRETALKFGFSAYLTKPVDSQKLIDTIAALTPRREDSVDVS